MSDAASKNIGHFSDFSKTDSMFLKAMFPSIQSLFLLLSIQTLGHKPDMSK